MARPRKAVADTSAESPLLNKDQAYWQAWINNPDLIGPYKKIARQQLQKLINKKEIINVQSNRS
jgi:hypothetical protein